MGSPVSKAQAAALKAAAEDVSPLEPIGAGYQVCVYDNDARRWHVTPEMVANEARAFRANALAKRALEILGHRPEDAEMAMAVVQGRNPHAARDKMLAAIGVLKGREVRVEAPRPTADPFLAMFRPHQLALPF